MKIGGETKLVDNVYCRNPEIANEIFEFLKQKGYAIGMSTVEIETGTHGKHVVRKLDLLQYINPPIKPKYNFKEFNDVILFNNKMIRAIQNKNLALIKEHICDAYDTVNPNAHFQHPCYEIITEAIDLLIANKWSHNITQCIDSKTGDDIGVQVIITTPEGQYFHSRFNHK